MGGYNPVDEVRYHRGHIGGAYRLFDGDYLTCNLAEDCDLYESSILMPEKLLLRAVLRQALMDLRETPHPLRKYVESAIAWFRGVEEAPFNYSDVADHLSMTNKHRQEIESLVIAAEKRLSNA